MRPIRWSLNAFKIPICVLVVGLRTVSAGDCNRNGVDDASDLLPQNFGFLTARSYAVRADPGTPIAADLNGDRKPDLATTSEGIVSVLINQGDGTFRGPTSYSVGDRPNSLITADLNGDETLDLMTANWGSPGSASILLNQGDGTFRDAVSYTVGAGPQSLIAADLNADGKLDLAAVNSDSCDLSVLLNEGNGSFKDAVSYAVGKCGGIDQVWSHPQALVASDFDGDGMLDLATANGDTSDVSILFNQGGGIFGHSASYRAGCCPAVLVSEDFNSDGKLDIATSAMGIEGVAVLLNRGDGTFQADATYAAAGGDLISTDLDGDGKPDIATSQGGILLNTGDGILRVAASYGGAWRSHLITADLNADGKPDLVTGGLDLSVFLNDGEGTFSDAMRYPMSPPSPSCDGCPLPARPVAADFNGDNHLDLAIVYVGGTRKGGQGGGGGNGVAVLINHGDGTLRDGSWIPAAGDAVSMIASDINGDGKPDVVLGIRGAENAGLLSGVSVLINQGDGTFADPAAYTAGGFGPGSLASADFDGDGNLDLVMAIRGCGGCNPVKRGALSVLVTQGGGNFEEAGIYMDLDFDPVSIVAADLDGDGKPDLATANEASEVVSVLLNSGGGSFLQAGRYVVAGFPSSLIAGDLDGDESIDLVTGNYPGSVSVLLNQSDGTFKPAGSIPVSGVSIAVPVVAADFNGDGRLDLVAGSESTVSLFLNQGDGLFLNEGNYVVGSWPQFLATADLNGDGKPDLATANMGALTSSVLLGRGDGTVEAALDYRLRRFPIALVAADFSGDGQLDLATGHEDGVFFLFNESSPPTSLDANHNAIPDECETRFHRGDPNSSGTTDIADAIAIFGYLFLGDAVPACKESADVQNDGRIDISDGISLLSWLFANGPAPVAPGPANVPCGVDPDAPGSVGVLGCVSFTGC